MARSVGLNDHPEFYFGIINETRYRSGDGRPLWGWFLGRYRRRKRVVVEPETLRLMDKLTEHASACRFFVVVSHRARIFHGNILALVARLCQRIRLTRMT